ncbi:MAG: DUF4439 domain-containing protein [Frankiaceae bacterium]
MTGRPALTTGFTAALATALAAEHAAVYGYGAAAPHLPERLIATARREFDEHRLARDRLVAALAGTGTTPPPAPPAYDLDPAPGAPADALALLVRLEEATAAAYARLLGATDDAGARRLAVGELQAAAGRATGWRLAAGTTPATEALPGLTGPTG